MSSEKRYLLQVFMPNLPENVTPKKVAEAISAKIIQVKEAKGITAKWRWVMTEIPQPIPSIDGGEL